MEGKSPIRRQLPVNPTNFNPQPINNPFKEFLNGNGMLFLGVIAFFAVICLWYYFIYLENKNKKIKDNDDDDDEDDDEDEDEDDTKEKKYKDKDNKNDDDEKLKIKKTPKGND